MAGFDVVIIVVNLNHHPLLLGQHLEHLVGGRLVVCHLLQVFFQAPHLVGNIVHLLAQLAELIFLATSRNSVSNPLESGAVLEEPGEAVSQFVPVGIDVLLFDCQPPPQKVGQYFFHIQVQ